jgi:hypothetical protein
LRLAAVQAITDAGRPMSAHEIQSWIAKHDENLSAEITSKCYDYVRMILSLSPPSMIRKYRSTTSVEGVDGRSGFFGLPDGDYKEPEWQSIVNMGRKRSAPKQAPHSDPRRNRPQIPVRPATSIFVDNPQLPDAVTNVDQHAVTNAWFALNTFIDRSDPLWSNLTEGIETMKSEIERGGHPDAVLKMVITTKPLMQNPIVFDDIITILSGEAGQKQEELWFTDILDNIV